MTNTQTVVPLGPHQSPMAPKRRHRNRIAVATRAGLRAAAALVATWTITGAHGAGFSPPSVSATMQVGQQLSFSGLYTTPVTGADRVDVFFLIDDTSSMGGVISNAKAGATAILNGLPSTYRYGVASYNGDPIEGVSPTQAFNRRTDLTTDRTAILSGINSITASGGGDIPEANLYALRQVASTSSWQAGAQHLVVWMGDAPGHTETVTTAQAASALATAGVKTVAFNSGAATTGIDGAYSSEPAGTRQASSIIAVTGGSLTNNFASLSSAQFVSTVLAQIERETRNLVFASSFAGTGLSVSVNCTDALGCNDVAGGAARSFAVTVRALQAGNYNFNVGLSGFSDQQNYSISVVPEPQIWSLLILGLAVTAGYARGRNLRGAIRSCTERQ